MEIKEKVSKVRMESGKYQYVFSFLEIGIFTVVVALCFIMRDDWIRGYYIIFWALLIMVFSFDGGILSSLLSIKAFNFIGEVQFEFYILHQPLIRVVQAVISIPIIATAISLIVIIIASRVYHTQLYPVWKKVLAKRQSNT